MTKKSHLIEKKNPQHNQLWEWEETPELLAAIEQLHKSSEIVKNSRVPKLHVGTNNFAPQKKSVVK